VSEGLEWETDGAQKRSDKEGICFEREGGKKLLLPFLINHRWERFLSLCCLSVKCQLIVDFGSYPFERFGSRMDIHACI